MSFLLLILAVLGFIIAVYAHFLEQKVKAGGYVALCDISDTISCSKPILSEHGKVLWISNSVIGMIYYAVIAALALCCCTWLIFYLSLAALGASVVLAYILYFKIKAVCLVCTCTYLINAAIFLVSLGHYI